jgi:hypothetical protein
MLGSKQKSRLSPELIDSDDGEQGSPVQEMGKAVERGRSLGRGKGISEGEGYDDDDKDYRRLRPGAPRPSGGGYRAHPT